MFSSAKVLNTYSIEQLIGLGVSWVWMGLEGEDSQYTKLRGVDTHHLVRKLQSHGIHVLGSTIIGMENHTPENIDQVIDHAVRHDTDFHQFMLYTPIPGTPLHAELTANGQMKDPDEYHMSDIHGQLIFNYHHPHIKDDREGEFILRAFNRDFEVNGPSTVRITRTLLKGWRRYRNHADRRIQRRYRTETEKLGTRYSALVGAAKLEARVVHSKPIVEAFFQWIERELVDSFLVCSAVGETGRRGGGARSHEDGQGASTGRSRGGTRARDD